MTRLLSRKFVVAMTVLIAATVLACLDKIAAANWETIALGVMGLYAAANVTQAIGLKDK